MIFLRLIGAVIFISQTFASSEVAPCTLDLTAEYDGRVYSEPSRKDGLIQALDGGAIVAVPVRSEWLLRGDLLENHLFIHLHPDCFIRRTPDGEILSIVWQAFRDRNDTWSERELKRGLLMFGWVLDGELVRVRPSVQGRTQFLPPTAEFRLTSEEASGFPIAFLVENGKFIPPRQMFKSSEDQRLFAEFLVGARNKPLGATPSLRMFEATTRSGDPMYKLLFELGIEQPFDHVTTSNFRHEVNRQRTNGRAIKSAAACGRESMVNQMLIGNWAVELDNIPRSVLVAVEFGHDDVAAALLRRFDLEEFQNRWQATLPDGRPRQLWDYALRNGLCQVAAALIDLSLIEPVPSDFELGLEYAVGMGSVSAVEWFLDQGADPNGTVNGEPLVMAAIANGDSRVLSLLLDRGASTESTGALDVTPIVFAIQLQNEEAVRLLLSHGADPNGPSDSHPAPLHSAVLRGSVGLATALLRAGANPEYENKRGENALMIALAIRNRELVELLNDVGVRISVNAPTTTDAVENAIALDASRVFQAALEDGFDPATRFGEGWNLQQVCKIYQSSACSAALGEHESAIESSVAWFRGYRGSLPKLDVAMAPRDLRDSRTSHPEERVLVRGIVDRSGEFCFPKLIGSASTETTRSILLASRRWRFENLNISDAADALRIEVPIRFTAINRKIYRQSEVDRPARISRFTAPRAGYASETKLVYRSGFWVGMMGHYLGLRRHFWMSCTVEPDGAVSRVDQFSGLGRSRYTDLVSERLKAAKWEPAVLDGKSVRSEIMLIVLADG